MLPTRDATEKYLEMMGRRLDIVFDVDLGELVRGHHVVARGIDLGHEFDVSRWMANRERGLHEGVDGLSEKFLSQSWYGMGTRSRPPQDLEIVETRLTEPELHYEFIPGLEAHESDGDPFFWYWMLQASDDVGSEYADSNNGVRGPSEGGEATHTTRDLGGRIPDSASRLVIVISPASHWQPPEPCRQELVIDLESRVVVESL